MHICPILYVAANTYAHVCAYMFVCVYMFKKDNVKENPKIRFHNRFHLLVWDAMTWGIIFSTR